MFRHRYPPTRYVCYPLYRHLRWRWRLPCGAAYFAVWVVSGVLLSAVLLVFGHPVVAGAFTLVFAGLGAVGAVAISIKNRRRNPRA